MKRMFSVMVGIAVLALCAGAAAAQDAVAQKGMEVFTAKKCTACHSIAGRGNKNGPLDEIGTKLSAAEIKGWITDPVGMAAKRKPPSKRKPPMMKTPLSDDEVEALVAFLSGLKKQ
jgi:mono/diheme cytochrome c family protein